MRDVFVRLGTDFLSTLVFLALYLTTGNVVLATSVAIAGAVAQVIYARFRGQPLDFMTYASLALVIVLGSATLLTSDPRFVLAKPSIAHFAIGAIMLRRGWMLRYVPPIVADAIPQYVTLAGYAWAVLMIALGLGTIAVAMTGDMKLWAIYVSVVAVGAKVLAFAVQYVAFRILVTRRIRAVGGEALSSQARDGVARNASGKKAADPAIGHRPQDALYPAWKRERTPEPFSVLRRKSQEMREWPWTETGTSPCRRRWAIAKRRSA